MVPSQIRKVCARRVRAAMAGPACLIALSVAVAAPAQPWAGTYTFSHSAGRTTGGSAMVVAYRLDIAPGRGSRDCLLRIEGFQTNETIVCKLRGDADSIAVDFHTYGDGRLVNVYGTKIYDIGAPLFTVRRNGAVLLTRWQALTPDGIATGTSTTAFQRQR